MRSAIVAVATGNPATHELVSMLASGLRARGHISTLIWASEVPDSRIPPPAGWPGSDILLLNAQNSRRQWIPSFPLLHLTRQIALELGRFDVVYSPLSGHPIMHAICERRHSTAISPLFVALVDQAEDEHHGEGFTASAIARRFGEAYVLKHCDLIACLDQAGPRQLANLAIASADPRVMSLDITDVNRLLAAVETHAVTVRPARTTQPGARRRGVRRSTLTICVSHSTGTGDAGRALHALDQQTSEDFTVIALDCTDSAQSAVDWAALAEKYCERGWTFRREPQLSEERAIARWAANASSPYLMFLDTDDLPNPHLVERALEAAEVSGDDLLEIWATESSADIGDGARELQGTAIRASYGLDLVNALGGNGEENPVFLVRRTAFDAVGGYPCGDRRGRGRQTLAVRIALAGYHTDVLPEVLNHRRRSGNTRRSDPIRDGEIFRGAFQERLNTIGMQSFAIAFQYTARQLRQAEQQVEARECELARRFPRSPSRERLRLLMLVPGLPHPPMSGARLRRSAMVRWLGHRHDLTLAAYCSMEESRHRHQFLRYCRSIYAAAWNSGELPGGDELPYAVRSLRRLTMRDALRAIPSQLYEAAIIDQIFLAPFRQEISTPAILCEQNIESHLLSQVAQTNIRSATGELSDPQREAELMRNYEDRVWPEFAVRSAANPEERDEIQRRAQTGQTILVENGTDPALWLAHARPDANRILFVGTLGWYPNFDAILHFWHDIWPHLVRRRPSAELIVAGSGATAELRELAQHSAFILVEDPPDLREVAASASASIAPLRLGAGTRLKVLDSMALGLPVVSTSLGCAGLAVEDGTHLLIRDDPAEFAEAVDELLAKRSLWRRLRRNGKALVQERYLWDKVLAPLETALRELAR